MFVLIEPYGQRSNNLFQHIHIDSFCRENGIIFYNKAIHSMIDDYPNIGSKNYFFELAIKLKFFQFLRKARMSKYIHLLNISDDEIYKKAILENKFLYGEGWMFRSFSTTKKYKPLYKNLFQPAVNSIRLNKMFLERGAHESLVGIHIRRGDYEEFEGGIYFYSDSVFIKKMLEIKQLLNSECKFIIFSNDINLNKKLYTDAIENVIFSHEPTIADHYVMSKCDYLIGPPSTFSLWASYMGEVPVYHITDASKDLLMSDFYICNG